jgi:transposase InsO family protein
MPPSLRRQERHERFIVQAGQHGRTKEERRKAEHKVRCRVIAFSHLADKCSDAAEHLSMQRQCLEDWRREWRARRLAPHPRGRPETKSGDDLRGKAFAYLEQAGPGISVVTLRSIFPGLGGNEAKRILADYRATCRNELRAKVRALQWKRPGSVWAMDHMEAPSPVDGEYPYVLVVRDLASQYLIFALPQKRQTDIAVADALKEAFIQYGAPMVIKSDNGSGFTGMETQEVLRCWGVEHLVSPPYFPPYNGAVEAGIGQLKTRTHIIAAQHNRPGLWTSDDLEGARLLANRTLRPWGRGGPTPEERWNRRTMPSERERARFRELNAHYLKQRQSLPPQDSSELREHHPYGKIVGRSDALPEWARKWNGETLGAESGATATGTAGNGDGQSHDKRLYYRKQKRESLTETMVATGLLAIKERVIPLPIKRIMRLKIS